MRPAQGAQLIIVDREIETASEEREFERWAALFNQDFQLIGAFFDDRPCDLVDFLYITGQQGAVADNVDQPGIAFGK